VSIDMFHAGRLKEMPGLLNASRFNGVILTNTLPQDDAFLAATTLPYPVVVLGRRLANYCCVLDTPGEIGRRAAEILLTNKRSRPILLVPALLTQSTTERADAFTAAVKAAVGREPARVIAEDFTPASGDRAVRKFLRGAQARCDALFAVTDSLAMGAYQALKNNGQRIPQDVAVVGVGDLDHSAFFDPPLTCVGPASEEIVRQVVAQLFRLMNDRTAKPGEIFVEPSVEKRSSA
jgi:LacI family transcriptional regulator